MRKQHGFLTSPRKESKRMDDFITVVLLCEKAGHRMKSYGPTPLIKIGGSTLLDKQISSLKSVFSSFELIICGGFDCEKIVRFVREKYKELNIRIVENQVYPHSNCCESARLCINNTTNSKILICNGDLLIDTQVFSLIQGGKSFIILEENPCKNFEIGVTINEEGNTGNLSFGIENIWSEMVFFHSQDVIESFRKIISNADYKNKFMFEALNDLIKTKHKLEVIVNVKKPITKISNIKTYHEVRKSHESTNTKLR